ncbi:MAG: translocase FtsK protein [Candidatus Woesebacteria bacterium GW2011_GWB1_43_14]|uniref:Translocase FtsK protein n=1 Tax=Candidatus Woesebacteria bacterium GW2011_GWB1_43_14 TaxID=1618578 RepID=A0A0G1DIB5_9BACT|nr:MAG: translocase FtsK protein [Candidatus Woesebacteria bacterium GW2011_GWA1_39_11b]KKS97419.1 MAG: translocase FtsK protein [Candidatus Woesebacteria bacterium GW2011_GWB1_43_14]
MGRKRRKKGSRKSSRGFGISLKRETIFSVIQIGFFALSGLVVISFSRRGSALVRLNDLLVLYFAWSSIFLPFIFLSIGFMISRLRFPLGQANVVIGMLLFFVSFSTLTRAGIVGRTSWEGVEVLVTPAGAFLVLLGTSIAGLIVLFNTSFDRVLIITGAILRQIRYYLIGDKSFKTPGFSGKRGLKVLGGNQSSQGNQKPISDKGNTEAKESLAPKLVSNMPGDDKVWKYPSLDLLEGSHQGKADRGDIKSNAAVIEQTLESFGITARVVEVNLGPAVTQYALEVALGTKLSKITALERDLALALAAPNGSIRIEAPIPGRSLVGIELPNKTPEFVPLKTMLSSEVMEKTQSKLAVSLGLDVAGNPVIADLADMPHILIAGQTGSGKSVCINAFLNTLLFRASPSEIKLILVDPKRVELTGYNDIPHLLSPVIVEPEKVVSALRWILSEMDRRYKLFAQAGARNIAGYNEMSGFQALPYIILVIDELADVMLFSPAEVEDSITRIAQMSRATGIHMILATQRPSVDVITGLIKANIPCRIAFAVSSQVDSRVILDSQGAEKLLGRGDMLYLSPSQAKAMRVQGAYVSDKEINALISFMRNLGINPQYTEEVVAMAKPGSMSVPGINGDTDDKFREAVELVCQFDRASASLLQRRLSVGYARAARILDQLESAGVVGQAEGSKPREVLVRSSEEFFGHSDQNSAA